jgi:hyperosmotically inducible periplasmic protein
MMFLLAGALWLPAAGAGEADRWPDQAAFPTPAADPAVAAKIRARLAKDKELHGGHIRVETDDRGFVQLSGTARSQAAADRAIDIAKNTQGVILVQSEIKVGNAH